MIESARADCEAAEFEAAREICRRHARSFYFASHFLPRAKRAHAYAVYAFCRLLDDAVDEAPNAEQQVARLVEFDELLDSVYDGNLPDEPTERDRALRAFAITVDRCRIPKRLFQELAEGCRMDLTIHRYADWPSLERYCYHVAGVVGVIMCHVFGLYDERSHRYAIAMGNAMQLTNILRDIGEDADRGRIYLPEDEIAQFGYSEAALQGKEVDAHFKELILFQIARARELYAEGAKGLPMIANDGSRFTASVMSSVYGGILRAIETQDYDVFRRRAHLNFGQKLRRVFSAWRQVRRAESPNLQAHE
ncbi:MAG: phytoene/squalene synthase family protein [Tepidisphaeraceae bacterium]